jgi:hypothetical protein
VRGEEIIVGRMAIAGRIEWTDTLRAPKARIWFL